MRRIILFGFFMIFIKVMLNGQISIVSDDMPSIDDTIRLSINFSDDSYDFEVTGEDHYWDFSDLGMTYQQVDTFVNPLSTPLAYQFVFIPVIVTNLAQKYTEFTWIPGFELTDVYGFYKKSGSDMRDLGFGFTLSGFPVPLKYNKPDIIYQFPVNYGNQDSSSSYYEIDFDFLYVGGWKKRVNEADGWGRLLTPYGEFDVLRVKSVVEQYDSIYIDSLGVGFPVTRNYIEYKWLGKNKGAPLLQVTEEGLVTTVRYVDSLRNPSANIKLINETIDMKIFPNPADSEVYVEFGKDLSGKCLFAEVYSQQGKLVYTDEVRADNNYARLNLQSLKKGAYLLIIKDDKGNVAGDLIVLK